MNKNISLSSGGRTLIDLKGFLKTLHLLVLLTHYCCFYFTVGIVLLSI